MVDERAPASKTTAGTAERAGPGLRRTRHRATRHLVAIGLAVLALLATSCRVNQFDLWAADKLSPAWVPPDAASRSDVAYGPLEAQRLDVWLPSGPPVGTIVYFHSGGWVGGDKTEVADFLLAEVDRGWAVVSVNHRLAGSKENSAAGADGRPTTAVEAPQIMADADRSIRYVKAHAGELGLNPGTVVAAGTSAGGWVAAMLATNPGGTVDLSLPPELAATSPVVDAMVDLVGPTDLTTLYQAGGWAPSLERALLGCEPDPNRPPKSPLTSCTEQTVRLWSPLTWAAVAAFLGIPPKPAYLGYGTQDGLVVPATQGDPFHAWLAAPGGDLTVWSDLTPNEGHNVDHQLNKTAFDLWLDKVLLRAW